MRASITLTALALSTLCVAGSSVALVEAVNEVASRGQAAANTVFAIAEIGGGEAVGIIASEAQSKAETVMAIAGPMNVSAQINGGVAETASCFASYGGATVGAYLPGTWQGASAFCRSTLSSTHATAWSTLAEKSQAALVTADGAGVCAIAVATSPDPAAAGTPDCFVLAAGPLVAL